MSPKDWMPIFVVHEAFHWPVKQMGCDENGDLHLEWWRYNPNQTFGGFDSYLSALASQSGCWEEYCEYHRVNRELVKTKVAS